MKDIRYPSFEATGMHFGATGSAGDPNTPAEGTALVDELLNAPESDTNTTVHGNEGPHGS